MSFSILYNIKNIYNSTTSVCLSSECCVDTSLGYLYKRNAFECIFVKCIQVVIGGPPQENYVRGVL